MFAFLKNHPFAVDAFFESSTVLTFAIPQQHLRPLVPDSLELDVFEDKWAFIAVAMVQTTDLRPAGLPRFLGNSFFLIGYRIFVRFTTKAGKRLRGLYILKSETDQKKMELLGNLFTHYHYTTTDITRTQHGNKTLIASQQSGFHVELVATPLPVPLPANSPFATWQQARRFAGPLPFTFTWLADTKTMLLIEGQRENWVPEPLTVPSYQFEFLDAFRGQGLVLASAFTVRNIPYHWKKGRLEPCSS
jgi:hypothetical protein